MTAFLVVESCVPFAEAATVWIVTEGELEKLGVAGTL